MSRSTTNLFSSFLFVGLASALPAQVVLSDFEGPTADGWSGVINGTTTFANGSTAVSGVDDGGNGVLNLSDAGFGGGAVRTYTGLPTAGFLTVAARGRIVTDPGNLNPSVTTPQFGASFGVAAGSTGLPDQAFGYSASLATAADDDNQAFALYAATVRADGSGDFTAFFTPDQNDAAVPAGSWVVQFDDVQVIGGGVDVPLSDFASGIDGWASTTAATSPFVGSAFTTIAQTGGELQLTDGGFTGAAYKTYAGAAAVAGVHIVKVDVRIVTDSGSLDRSRIAAVAGGATTVYTDLSWSQSFATTGDDSGQAYQTVAVPVITSGASDITVYVMADYDGVVSSGSWDIRIDNVRIQTCVAASSAIYGSATVHPINGLPFLDVIDDLRLGTTGKLRLVYDNAAMDPGTILFGTGRAAFPFFDGLIQVQTIWFDLPFSTVTPFTQIDFDFPVPNDPSLCSPLPLNMQVVMRDFAMETPFGVVFSNGAEMFVGF